MLLTAAVFVFVAACWVFLPERLFAHPVALKIWGALASNKGIVLAATAALLFLVVLHQAATKAAALSDIKIETRQLLPAIGAGVMLTSLVAAIGALGYQVVAHSMEQEAFSRLNAIADLKARDLGSRLAIRKRSAMELGHDLRVVSVAERAVRTGALPDGIAAAMIRDVSDSAGFVGVDLIDSSLRSLLRSDDALDPELGAAVTQSLTTQKPLLADLHGVASAGRASLGYVVPVSLPDARVNGLRVALYVEIEARDDIHPTINSWPLTGAPGTVMLARRDGDNLLILRDPAGAHGSAGAARLPLATSSMPVARYLRGETDAARGFDRTDASVLAATRDVPGTNWTLSAEIREDDALASLNDLARSVLQLAILGVILAWLIGGVLWQRRRLQEARAELASSQALNLSERRFSETFEQAAVGMAHIGLDGRLLRCNQKLCDISGYSRAELQNMPISRLSHPDEAASIEQALAGYRAGRLQHVSTERRYLRKNGGVIPVAYSVTLVHGDAAEPPYLMAVIQDISRRRKAEDALRESEERFRLAMLGANEGLWDWRIDRNEVYYSPRWKAMLGFEEHEIENTPRAWMRLASREGIAALKAHIRELQNGARTACEIELKLRHKDGRWLDILTRGFPVFGENGAMVRIVGTNVDITMRKKHEADLRMAATVFTSTHEGVVVTNATGDIVLVNPAFSTITGYPAEEILGGNMRSLRSGQHDRSFYQDMWATIRATGYWQGEIWNRRKSGEVYPEWLTISTVRDESGAVANYVGAFTDISRLKQSESKLEFLAHHDPLTSLPNRLLFNARVDHAVQRAQEANSNGAVLFLDLDRFKTINDSLGHPAGDEMLMQVAARLKNCLRASDTIARLGGDEFVVMIENYSDIRDIAIVSQKLSDEIGQPFVLSGGREVYVGLSIGVSLFPSDGATADALIQHADSALYLAKKSGGASVRFYSVELTRAANTRLELEAGLRRGIERAELALQYQPLVRLGENRIVGVEALVRWKTPAGLVPPMQFIPVAEETSLIIPLGEWVLREACTRMKAWLDAGNEIDVIAVNLSVRQLDRANICDRIGAILAETGLSPERLEIEITESALMAQGAEAAAKLAALKALGLRISIDDFGTGYSSLAYLKRFPIDKLKVDRSFISDIPVSAASMEITAAIIRLARSLQVEPLAEGVETRAQADFLRAAGCNMAQGFYFAKPMWEDELLRRFAQNKARLSNAS